MTTRRQAGPLPPLDSPTLELLDTRGTPWAGPPGKTRGCRRCRARRRGHPGSCQLLERGVVRERRPNEPDPSAAGPRPPRGTACGNAASPPRGDLGEILVRLLAAANPTSEKPAAAGPVGQVVDGGQQLLARQVAGDAEDHQHAGTRDMRHPFVPSVAQRITHPGRPRHGSSVCRVARCRCPGHLATAISVDPCQFRPSPGSFQLLIFHAFRSSTPVTSGGDAGPVSGQRRAGPLAAMDRVTVTLAVLGDGMQGGLRHGVDRARPRPVPRRTWCPGRPGPWRW